MGQIQTPLYDKEVTFSLLGEDNPMVGKFMGMIKFPQGLLYYKIQMENVEYLFLVDSINWISETKTRKKAKLTKRSNVIYLKPKLKIIK